MSIVLVSLGISLCFFGLLGIAAVIYFGFKIRKETKIHGEKNKKAMFQQLIVLNYLSVCLSTLGLIILVLGIFLS